MNLQDGTTQFKVRDARCHHALGEIVALIVTPPPYEHLVECNGQTLVGDEYADLIKALGTNVVPNLNGEGRFLQGSNTAGNKVEQGLPDPEFDFLMRSDSTNTNSRGISSRYAKYGNTGIHYLTTGNTESYSMYGLYVYRTSGGTDEYMISSNSLKDGSEGIPYAVEAMNTIYGRSSTVQPPAYTVKYYICYGE